MLDRLKALWATNPVRVTAITASLIVFIAAKAGVVIDQPDVLEALALALPVLLGGEVARSQVSRGLWRVRSENRVRPRRPSPR